MKKLSRKFAAGAAAVSSCLAMTLSAPASAQDLNKELQPFYECVEAILLGPTKNKLKVFGHQMNCKQGRVEYSERDNSIWVKAIVSMHRSGFSDPQTLISFHVFPDGRTSHIEYFITPEKAAGWSTEGFQSRNEINQWRRAWPERNVGLNFSVGFFVALEAAARVSDSRFRALGDIKTGDLEWYIDRPGGDMSRTLVDGGPRDCLRMCYENRACMAWTWVRPGVQDKSAVCWQKRSTQKARVRFNPDTVSGLKSAYALME